MNVDLHRDLGKHDAQIEALQDEVRRLHRDMSNIVDELKKINETLSQAKGGWKTLMAVAGGASAITAFIVKIFGWYHSA